MFDPRFARLHNDPRFRRIAKKNAKVVVDERFKGVFDEKRKSGARIDKYGRKISSKQRTENLRRFYRQDKVDKESEGDVKTTAPDYARGAVLMESSDEEEEESAESDVDVVVLGRQVRKPTERETSPEIDLNEDVDAVAGRQTIADASTDGTKKNRLAVVNLDWDHVKATHLYKIVSSLVSPTGPTTHGSAQRRSSANPVVRGRILSVRVYPSKFGAERMKKEEIEGPPKELFKARRIEDLDEVEITAETLLEQEDSEAENEALRKYQLERLRYYYAIVECDSYETASHIYSELDGTELERTGNIFDLSFVPNDMTFEQEPRDEATPETEEGGTLHSTLDFSTEALRHSKVKLTWDDDDPERNKFTRRTLSKQEMLEGNFRSILASASEDESEDDDQDHDSAGAKERARALLLEGADADPFFRHAGFGDDVEDGRGDEDLEVTFTRALEEDGAKGDEETTLDKYKKKRREQRLQRMKEKKERREAREVDTAKAKKPINDEFFGEDSEEERAAELPRTEKPGKDRTAKQSRRSVTFALPDEEEMLSTAAGEPSGTSNEQMHFAMDAILKAEKLKGKKHKRTRKKNVLNEDADLVQEEFTIDVKDDRFAALHKDHTFALDPTNPHYKSTSSMAKLVEEQIKRRKYPDDHEKVPTDRAKSNGKDPALRSLVQTVKRLSSSVDQSGHSKRRKT